MTVRKKKSLKTPIKFIDLFAGIGGIRIAFEHAGAECVFSSEWNKFAQQTYEKNFGELPVGDIREIQASDLPDFDIMCAGFPCQPFSIAGVSKKQSLNKPHGFEDETQGTLFYEIIRILKEKKPAAFFLDGLRRWREPGGAAGARSAQPARRRQNDAHQSKSLHTSSWTRLISHRDTGFIITN